MAENQIGKNNPSKPDPALWNPTSGVKPKTIGQYKTLSYPQQLGSDRYPFYMMFYINANSKSALAKNNAGLTAASNQLQNTEGGIVGFVKDSASQAASKVVQFIPPNKRLDIAMALPIPNDVSFSHTANYQLAGSGVLGTLLKTFTTEGAEAMGKAALEQVLTQTAPNFLLSAGAGALGAVGLNSAPAADLIAIKNKILGIAQNERKEQVFKSMEPRTFQFSWLLIPRTEQESQTIENIVKFFKYNQYPEIPADSNGLNVIIPNEVDIEFHNMDGEMKTGISKISTCVIDTVNVSYTPLGKWIAFDGTNNPVAIQLSIVFKEIEPLTRTMVSMGY